LADFAELARGLLTLEINTVQKDGMSAQKMPSPANALVEIAQDYHDFLRQRARDFGAIGDELPNWAARLSDSFDWGREPFPRQQDRAIRHPEGVPRPPGHNGEFLKEPPGQVSVETFDDIREIASWLREMYDRVWVVASGPSSQLRTKLTDDVIKSVIEVADRWRAGEVERSRAEVRAVLSRIQRNSDQLKPIVRDKFKPPVTRASPEQPDAATLVLIRKAWDIGTEVVVMQTVIQIDGDVVNRIQPGRETGEYKPLHDLHKDAVDISFRYWRWLIEALGRFAGQAVSSLLK
jgi:hypothetical protein